ncbi:MAG: tyrosine-type recombinase/integrase, partial [Elusimicrobia bacterium]|nr:tyrosine-type recombinase/integrase [Elusimicrobiota bacterium]
ARQLRWRGDGPVTFEQVDAAVARYDAKRERRIGRRLRPLVALSMQRVTRRWLKFLGRLPGPAPLSTASRNILDDFLAWMDRERGFSPRTIDQRRRDAERFLKWHEARGRSPGDVAIQDIDEYLAERGTHGWNRISVGNQAHALRAFFQHVARRGWCSALLPDAIRGPKVYFHESLPTGPTWEEVQRIVASMDTNRPRDIRDRAAVLLMATYGLRVSEVAHLRLEDVDWERDLIHVQRPKQRRSQTYPLTSVVGNAIAKYLELIRPRCGRQEVFLTLFAPLRPLTQAAFHQNISKHVLALGLSLRRRGPHALRHACATHLVEQGFSLKEIGDHLGHRSAVSTRVYAKVDLPSLRKVAEFELGGVAWN